MPAGPDDDWNFRYQPGCAAPDCDRPPVVKIAAVWSNGPLQELKNYGLACQEHCDRLLALAAERRRGLAISDDEQVGPVQAIALPASRVLDRPASSRDEDRSGPRT